MENLVMILKEENRMLRDQLSRRTQEDFSINKNETNFFKEKSEFYSNLINMALENFEKGTPDVIKNLNYLKKKRITSYSNNNFTKATEVFKKSNLDSLEKELLVIGASKKEIANILTGVAKNIRGNDKKNAYFLAKQAWILHPKMYRLKWLAFRAGDAGFINEAVFIFDILKNQEFTPAEKKVMDRYIKQAPIPVDSIKLQATSNLAIAPGLMENENSVGILGEIRDQLKLFISSHTKEVTYLLDCMDEQKEVIKDCANDAFINAIGKIREYYDQEYRHIYNQQDEQRKLLGILNNYLSDDAINFKKELNGLSLSSLKYLLTFQNLLKNKDYATVMELGNFLGAQYFVSIPQYSGASPKRFITAAPAKNALPHTLDDSHETHLTNRIEIHELDYKKFKTPQNGEWVFYDCGELFPSISSSGAILLLLDNPLLKNANFSPLPLLGECLQYLPNRNFDILIHRDLIEDADALLQDWQIAANIFGINMERGEISDFDGLYLQFGQI